MLPELVPVPVEVWSQVRDRLAADGRYPGGKPVAAVVDVAAVSAVAVVAAVVVDIDSVGVELHLPGLCLYNSDQASLAVGIAAVADNDYLVAAAPCCTVADWAVQPSHRGYLHTPWP